MLFSQMGSSTPEPSLSVYPMYAGINNLSLLENSIDLKMYEKATRADLVK
jgi:hypothetical protein